MQTDPHEHPQPREQCEKVDEMVGVSRQRFVRHRPEHTVCRPRSSRYLHTGQRESIRNGRGSRTSASSVDEFSPQHRDTQSALDFAAMRLFGGAGRVPWYRVVR